MIKITDRWLAPSRGTVDDVLVLPARSVNDVPHVPGRNSKSLAQNRRGFNTDGPRGTFDLCNLLGSEDGSLAAPNVDLVRHRFKVVGVDARLNLAQVIRFQSVRNRAVLVFVHLAMHSISDTAKFAQPVPVLILAALPNPTRRCVSAILNRIKIGAQKIVVPAQESSLDRSATTTLTQTRGNVIVGVRHLESPTTRREGRHGTGLRQQVRSFFVPQLYHFGGTK